MESDANRNEIFHVFHLVTMHGSSNENSNGPVVFIHPSKLMSLFNAQITNANGFVSVNLVPEKIEWHRSEQCFCRF